MIYTAPDDYAGGTYMIMFSAGSKTAKLQIPIVNDEDIEEEEDFFGSIITSASSVIYGLRLGPKRMTTVSIQDDDSKCMQNISILNASVDIILQFAVWIY